MSESYTYETFCLRITWKIIFCVFSDCIKVYFLSVKSINQWNNVKFMLSGEEGFCMCLEWKFMKGRLKGWNTCLVCRGPQFDPRHHMVLYTAGCPSLLWASLGTRSSVLLLPTTGTSSPHNQAITSVPQHCWALLRREGEKSSNWN